MSTCTDKLGISQISQENRSVAARSAGNVYLRGDLSAQAWYALKVQSRGEIKAAENLGWRGFQSYCPVRKEKKKYCDRVKVVEQAVIPGYLFCRLDMADKVALLSSPHVDYIVSVAGVPAIVPDHEIEQLRRVIELGAHSTPYLRVGQMVRVSSGPLAGVTGILRATAKATHLVVSVDLLGRSVAIEIDRDHVEPL